MRLMRSFSSPLVPLHQTNARRFGQQEIFVMVDTRWKNDYCEITRDFSRPMGKKRVV